MNRKALALLPLFFLALTVAAAESTDELRSGVFDPPRLAPDFSLRGTDGSEFKLSRYRGKVVALGFGYSNCPSVCPLTLRYLAQAREKLGARGKEFQVVYVTVDPERDNAEHLGKFLASFDPTFVGAKATYFLDHSSFVYLIDRGGKLRAMMPFGVTVDDIEHDARALLSR